MTASVSQFADRLYSLVEDLYPICRSITGDGVRQTLSIIGKRIPLAVHEVPTGTSVFDWNVPNEWNIRDAWIKDPDGNKVVDFRDHSLHVLNYSAPVRETLSLGELRNHLYSLPEQPDLIPYKTSYYKENWGFCLSHNLLESLPDGNYEVLIDSTLQSGSLTYGELLIPGKSEQEVLFSAHVCHPSLANDNLSGIAVLTELAAKLAKTTNRYSYRFLFIPGTIGSICWLARNQGACTNIRCGLVASLLGDAGNFTYKKSRRGNADIDYLVQYVMEKLGVAHKLIDFFPYGYDERQFSSPGIDLDVGNLTRSQYGTFPEYHTSADNLDFISSQALEQSYNLYSEVVEHLESSRYFTSKVPNCEPQLGRRGLYDDIGGLRNDVDGVMAVLWVLNCANGLESLYTVSQKSGIPVDALNDVADMLVSKGLIADTKY